MDSELLGTSVSKGCIFVKQKLEKENKKRTVLEIFNTV